jgi:hypothetical protein
MNIRASGVIVATVATIGVASLSVISTYAPVVAANYHPHHHHHHPTGNDV